MTDTTHVRLAAALSLPTFAEDVLVRVCQFLDDHADKASRHSFRLTCKPWRNAAGTHLQQLRSSQQQLTGAGVAPKDAVSGLHTICPNIAILMLADITLDFDDLQSLSQLRQLRYLHLQNIPFTRETFIRSTSASQHDHVFAHLAQLTTLVLSQTQYTIQFQYCTEDLYGLSHLTNLSSLAVKTFVPSLRSAKEAFSGTLTAGAHAYLAQGSNAYIEPVVQCAKLASLPHLTSVQLSTRPPSLCPICKSSGLTV